jgi:hypothetical protein
MKILFISYYFEPFPGVGAKRVSYWVNNCSKYDIKPTVLTATKQLEKKEHILYLPPESSGGALSHFIKDPGLNWKKSLMNYFKGLHEFDYDFVLISGGPFMHFEVTNYLKKVFNAKVVLDFRDPFSNNPSFRDNGLKKRIKSYFEKKFIKNAAAIIAVNKYCAELVVSNQKVVEIIDNGFDENEFNANYAQVENEVPIIAHAGTFIQGLRSPEIFLKTLNDNLNGKVEFHQFGKDSTYFDDFRSAKFFINHGLIAYNSLIQKLENADICLLITEGKSFESTTKIFDYIGLNKKILIITSGEVRTGNLHQLTVSYPNVVWCENNADAIQNAIDKLLEMEVKPFDSYKYSRAYSLEKLVDLLKSL